jgi:hypothetical protein
MSDPLPVTELVAFRPAEVKAGKILVPVLLANGEWAALSATPSVMRQMGGSIDAAFDSISRLPSPAKRTLPR